MYHTIFCNDKIVYRYDMEWEKNQLERIPDELNLGRYCPSSIHVNHYEVDYPIRKALREAYPNGFIDWDYDELVLPKYAIRRFKKLLEEVYWANLYEQYSNLFMFYEGGEVFCREMKESEPMYQRYTYLQALQLPNDPVIECTSGSALENKIKEFNGKTDFFFYRVIDAIVRFAEEHPDLEDYRFCRKEGILTDLSMNGARDDGKI